MCLCVCRRRHARLCRRCAAATSQLTPLSPHPLRAHTHTPTHPHTTPVDVTTEPPAGGYRALDGTTVCIGGRSTDWYETQSSGTEGVAFFGSFGFCENADLGQGRDASCADYQPAFIFAASSRESCAYWGAAAECWSIIASTISHEVGHTLGLSHTGLAGVTEYYEGSDFWSPIMGGGWLKPTETWTKGLQYPGANNDEDAVAVMAGYAGRAPPDHGATAASAS